jgi:acetyltransferase-like isoleucine patch superfamily enzyme
MKINIFKYSLLDFIRILGAKKDYLKTQWWWKKYLKKCGKGSIIRKPLFITPETISMHDFVCIWFHARIEGVKSRANVLFIPEIILHDHVSIQQNLHLTCANRIEIGRFTAIAANVTITDIHHPYTDVHLPIEEQPLETKPVYIGDECKLYNNCVILPGTYIGKHCTVGANSVVSGNFPDYSVIAGVPAKIIKKYNPITQVWEK